MRAMGVAIVVPQLLALAVAGVLGGLWLLARGLGSYRLATHIGDTATSAIASMAAGEVRVSGTIEPAELLLISPLQSASCIYYRSSIRRQDEGPELEARFREERAVGFRVCDPSGDVRVFPRGARWDAPVRFDEHDALLGDVPAGLALRAGSALAPGPEDRAAEVARLLSVPTAPEHSPLDFLAGGGSRGLHYTEARLAPGDTVTIVGRALPFSDLSDPTEADLAIDGDVAADDPEVAADLAEARAEGHLADDAEDAWGNAAIAGFGIGRPVRTPELDPAAHPLPLAPAADAARAERTFSIAPETLVLASTIDGPLLIVDGAPGTAVERSEGRFVLGLLGAILAIGSAMAVALMLSGGPGS
jgi:hypothetical protein